MTPVDVTDHLNSNLPGLSGLSCASDYILSAMCSQKKSLAAVLKRSCTTEIPLFTSLVLRVTTMDMKEMDFKGAEKIIITSDS